MTPPTVTVTRAGTGRRYEIDGKQVPGVTTILDKGYPKPALVGWAADETARWASENLDVMRAMGPVAGYEKARKARFETNKRAKVRGTNVHDLAEKASHLKDGEEIAIPPELVGYVDSALRFLDDFDVDPLATEQTVASAKHGYCGTFDLYAMTNRGRMLLDYKTSKGPPWPEAALQLAAYRHAEWWVWPGAERVVASQPIEETAVVWLTPERYEVFPTASGPDVFRQFLYVAEVAKITGADRSLYIGEPLGSHD